MKAMSARSVSVLLASRATLWVRCLVSLLYFFKSSTYAGILEQSMGARNREGTGLSYRLARARIYKPFKETRNRFPAWRNRFLGSLNFYKYRLWLHRLAESIPQNRFLYPNLQTQFLLKQAQNARFQWLKTRVSLGGLFSWQLCL